MENKKDFAHCVIRLKNGIEYNVNDHSINVHDQIHIQRQIGGSYAFKVPLFICVDSGEYVKKDTFINIDDIETISGAHANK